MKKNQYIKSLFGVISIHLLNSCGPPTAPHNAGELVGPCLTPFATVTASSSGKEVIINSTTLGGDEVAQSFRVSSTKPIYSVQLQLARIGAPSVGDLTLTIQTDSAGVPDGTSLASATLPVAHADSSSFLTVQDISTTATYYNFSFSSTTELTLDPAKTYWLRLKGTYTSSDTSSIKWYANDANVYTTGQAIYKTSKTANTWATTAIGTSRDLLFVITGGC